MSPYAVAVLDTVEQIPWGKVMSYSDVAEMMGRGTGRTVGTVMGRHGSEVCWHRVLRSDGSCAVEGQLALLRTEGVPIKGERVDMERARWAG